MARRIRDYRAYLRAVGRKPPGNERPEKRPGHVEIVYREGDYRLHRYEDERAMGRG